MRASGTGKEPKEEAGKAGCRKWERGLSGVRERRGRSRLEEKFLEENILLLRKQLNCLRRRDAGLLNQLQELDKQISDLRLDVEKTSEEHLETDSRPSSGFYELSDGASGSLSNSSNSVFSECLSSCHSSTCFCSPLEATMTISDSCLKSTDVNPKYQCDLVSKNGNDVYRYPSPLHAVAVQSPMFLLCLTGHPLREEERLGHQAGDLCVASELDDGTKTDSSLPSPSGLWPASHALGTKKMDGYILSLVQKKTHPVRTNKPRTSVTADPTKGLLRNASVCVRAAAGVPQSNGVNLKTSKQVSLPAAGTPPSDSGASSPLKQWSKDPKAEQLEGRRPSPPEGCSAAIVSEPPSAKAASQEHAWGPTAGPTESLKEGSQLSAGLPKDGPGGGAGAGPESKVLPPPKKMATAKSSLQASSAPGPPPPPPPPPPPAAFAVEDRPGLDFKSEGSSSQSPEEGRLVKARFIPGQGPDSEYSAECESLFHSTVVDTSEDERSNYTTNCFGDSESSVSDGEFVGESTSTSDSEESGGLIWSQFVQTLPVPAVAAQDLRRHPAKAFVKIKASHNLKKKILRFRSGSLKLMTTV
ncbi:PREDICTED: dapper homolog 1 [Dipodomys ordii]|uniref:Dapper homolog 1 n=1 Tax=Dipodomys ordii TaxID=10020 RepID=A0A1S3EZR5_DIPOR|nr:PREDICTED: dapper homolog 1 [Dipodomys ordii]